MRPDTDNLGAKMEITARTRKSHYWNEDRFVIGRDFLMVIDGATPLIKKNDFNEARWLVDYIKKNINKRQGAIKERLLSLSQEAFDKLPSAVKEEIYLPSASMSWVEYDDIFFYASVLGDCEVCFITKQNEILRVYSGELAKLDKVSIGEMVQKAREHNIHNSQARKYISETLIKHRKMINKSGGYNAFALMQRPIINAHTFKIKKQDVKEIYLYSDGFSQSFESLKVYPTHEAMFDHSLDLDAEIENIVLKAFKDPYCDKYPRLKKIDDITAIKAVL